MGQAHGLVLVLDQPITSGDYRHVPTGTLAMFAQRMGKVFASASTWYRLVREKQWRRPRQRVHPRKPKVGVRASKSNEIWHIDTTVIRLLDGSRAYLHAVIDNFSRRIPRFEVKRRMRCTSGRETADPRNWKRPGKRHAKSGQRPIASKTVLPAGLN